MNLVVLSEVSDVNITLTSGFALNCVFYVMIVISCCLTVLNGSNQLQNGHHNTLMDTLRNTIRCYVTFTCDLLPAKRLEFKHEFDFLRHMQKKHILSLLACVYDATFTYRRVFLLCFLR